MVHATSTSQYHAGALEHGLNGVLVKWCSGSLHWQTSHLVVGLDVVGEVVPGDRLNVLGGAQDGAAQGGALGWRGFKLAYFVGRIYLTFMGGRRIRTVF